MPASQAHQIEAGATVGSNCCVGLTESPNNNNRLEGLCVCALATNIPDNVRPIVLAEVARCIQPMRGLAAVAIVALAACASPPPRSPEADRIPVTTGVPSQKYHVLGYVNADIRSTDGRLDPPGANRVLQDAAYKLYGSKLDAVIDVQYSAVKGVAYSTLWGTHASGIAIQYDR